MFGVVLWRDEQEQKAVIWCEDHGDLAFYRNTDGTSRFELDAGDWVQFDMTMERHQRFAHNPRLVSEGVYPDLADSLCVTSVAEPVQQHAPVSDNSAQNNSTEPARGSAQIIPFQSTPSTHRRALDWVQANWA